MKKLYGLIVIIGVFIFSNVSVNACWIYLSLEDLALQADAIAIVNYNGDKTEDNHGEIPKTIWNVRVEAIYKGDLTSNIFIETTGSDSGKIKTSIDYKLTDNSEESLLLFLRRQENGNYEPLSPAGVVVLKEDNEGTILNKYVLGAGFYEFSNDDVVELLSDYEVIMVEQEDIIQGTGISRDDLNKPQSTTIVIALIVLFGMISIKVLKLP